MNCIVCHKPLPKTANPQQRIHTDKKHDCAKIHHRLTANAYNAKRRKRNFAAESASEYQVNLGGWKI